MLGQTYGRLTVEAFSHKRQIPSGQFKFYWRCSCECGGEHVVDGAKLRHGRTKSCGCIEKERRHGHALKEKGFSPTYMSWISMRQRCLYPKHVAFHNYGGRGITICERWLDFRNFLADMGERPKDRTLDRIDVNGNYEPGNCRWATAAEQTANRRSKRGQLEVTQPNSAGFG